MESNPRYEVVSQLQTFQKEDLDLLLQKLGDLDKNIEKVETQVANHSNLLSAARGVVAMRGGKIDYAASKAQRRSSKCRPNQRKWSQENDGTVPRHSKSLPLSELPLPPCGLIYTAFHKRFEAPRQSFTGTTGSATLVISQHSNRKEVLLQWSKLFRRLKPGKRLWILYWFDRNASHWRHFVRPPRARGGFRVGLFATRSPNRPTPIGLSLSVVDSIDPLLRHIFVSGVDVLDETPLIGVKEYIEERDCFFDSRSGWLDDHGRIQPLYYDPVMNTSSFPTFTLEYGSTVSEQIEFIDRNCSIDVQSMIYESLRRTSFSDACSLAEPRNNAFGCLPVGAYRVHFTVKCESNEIHLTHIVSGMRREVCESEANSDPEARLHLEFHRRFHR
ncbi:tRNA (adenine(37)-N6)-methyltransferase [Gracilariopsis chorda]|uniref:tRNA (Adenine(37)-N6)-methyltransferase n=1 Tax=Gracilariopsis chorda TaxID=448386 RepID=A0A2V3INE8_9FLOR|nr:tRNA (adenine(37)-N6)-methyltransferase [Gracilariopsis chorda]|eukprot:PXF43606.1 tRNA (adenine(37)-N6)-methyltransferase [Gracilariopsis chorda]